MDNLCVRKRGPKQSSHDHESNSSSNKKKKPIKVVHFSDPKRIFTTPEEFKGCVQLYTGRHSDVSRVFELGTELGTPVQGGPDQMSSSTSTGSGSTASATNAINPIIDTASIGMLTCCVDDGDDIFAGLYTLEDTFYGIAMGAPHLM